MSVVLDTSVVVALAIADEPDHEAVRDWIEEETDELVTTPLALAEIDHVVERRAGRDVADLVMADFRRGAYRVHWWHRALDDSLDALWRERKLGVGLVDASLLALAAHLGTRRVATLDQRHFRNMQAGDGPLILLPADA